MEVRLNLVEEMQIRAVDGVRRLVRNNISNGGQVLDTIGIELESIGLHKETVSRLLKTLPAELGVNFTVTHDASGEIMAYNIPLKGRKAKINIPLNAHTKEAEQLFSRIIMPSTYGYELVSKPMDRELMELSLFTLLPMLESNGDFLSERCATHIHVGMAKNLQFAKNLLRLGLWFDEVFYALAGMGRKFRGYSNNAIYARPLINGPYFHYDSSYYQVLNWEKSLQATNFYEFFAPYGVNINRDAVKYTPARYFAINLYSIALHKTIEFRHFNQSFDPLLVSSIAKLCQLFAELGVKGRDRELRVLEPGDVFELKSASYYIDKLHRLLFMGRSNECTYGLDSSDIISLENIIMKYQGIGIKDVPVLTHCRDWNIEPNVIEDGELKKTRAKPIPDGHVDIHNIKRASILGK